MSTSARRPPARYARGHIAPLARCGHIASGSRERAGPNRPGEGREGDALAPGGLAGPVEDEAPLCVQAGKHRRGQHQHPVPPALPPRRNHQVPAPLPLHAGVQSGVAGKSLVHADCACEVRGRSACSREYVQGWSRNVLGEEETPSCDFRACRPVGCIKFSQVFTNPRSGAII